MLSRSYLCQPCPSPSMSYPFLLYSVLPYITFPFPILLCSVLLCCLAFPFFSLLARRTQSYLKISNKVYGNWAHCLISSRHALLLSTSLTSCVLTGTLYTHKGEAMAQTSPIFPVPAFLMSTFHSLLTNSHIISQQYSTLLTPFTGGLSQIISPLLLPPLTPNNVARIHSRHTHKSSQRAMFYLINPHTIHSLCFYSSTKA